MRAQQLQGFEKCLSEFSRISFNDKISESEFKRFRKIFPKDLPIDQFPKYFKGVLAYTFSINANQELPEVPLSVDLFDVFPRWRKYLETQKRISKSKSINSNKRFKTQQTLWNLLQCKTLASKVPKDMILKAYEDHSSVLQEKSSVSEAIISELKTFLLPYLEELKKEFKKPCNLPLPNRHSTLESNRQELGNLGYAVRESLLQDSILKPFFKRNERIDPILIHIMGKPGIGKSHSVQEIVKQLTQQFSLDSSDVYYRNAHTEHWDGYDGQLVTVIDDFNYQLTKEATELSPELREFLTLKSDCEYVLPMAHLNHKGKRFTSKFLIITSNKGNRCPVQFVEKMAFYRRLERTYVMNQRGKFEHLPEGLIPTYDEYSTYQIDYSKLGMNRSVLEVSDLVKDAMTRYYLVMGQKPSMQISREMSMGGRGFRMELPTDIPDFAEVKAHAIAEPLKVRMITIGSAKNWPLKVIQLHMFNALKKFKIFEPCHNPNIQMNVVENESFVLLSGDYSAATDGLSWQVSQTILQSIGELVRKAYPELYPLYELESGSHLVTYPDWTGIQPIVQTNGQLMGSLLSFPVLCLANAFTLTRLFPNYKLNHEVAARIHGDDLLTYCPGNLVNGWKQFASSLGLKPSLGKNYVHARWGSIDSQLFFINEGQLKQLPTGKFSLWDSESKDLDHRSAIRTLLEKGYSIPKIRRCAQSILKKIPFHSLDIEWKEGGLRLEESIRPMSRTEKFVNEYYSINSSKVREIGPSIFSLPAKLAQTLPKSCYTQFLEDKTESSESPHMLSEHMRRAFKSKRKLLYDRLPVIQNRITVFSVQDLKFLNERGSIRPVPPVGIAKITGSTLGINFHKKNLTSMPHSKLCFEINRTSKSRNA